MRMLAAILMGLQLTSVVMGADAPRTTGPEMFPQLQEYLANRIAEFSKIDEGRKKELQTIADYVTTQSKAANQPIRLTFICTHNSRRSHMAQIWAATAARYYGIPNVETFSGGTEATAFNPRAVAALGRTGLRIEQLDNDKNPHFAVRIGETGEPMNCFSKVYDQPPNPMKDYCAVMTCSQADKNCPVVTGSSLRVAIPFEDPKVSDGKPEESATYDERCQQICREMLYVCSLVKR